MITIIVFISIYNADASNHLPEFVIHPSTTQNQMLPVSIPLTMNNLSYEGIRSIELNICYDPAVLTATGISLTNTVLENQNYLHAFNTTVPGIIYALFASSANIYSKTGLLLNLDFTVIGTAGETSDITLSKALFNNQASTISDGLFTVAPNAPPIITGITSQAFDEDTTLSTSFTLNDDETLPCDLTLTIDSSDETIVPANSIAYTCIAGEYTLAITPLTNQSGTVSLTITATDSGNLSSTAYLALTITDINDAPQISSISDQTTDEDIALTTITFTATDPETVSCNLSITLTSSNQTLFSNAGLSLTCHEDQYTITASPESNQSGFSTITVTVADAQELTASTAFGITVISINDPPVISVISGQTTPEDTTSTITFTASDYESVTCSLIISAASSDPTLVTDITYACDHDIYTLTINPALHQNGIAHIAITATDSDGMTATQSFSLTVTAVNDLPSLSTVDPQNINEGTSINITLTAADIEGDALSLTIVSSNQSLIQDSDILLTNDGNTYTITITPLESQAGNANITVSVSDGSDITSMTFLITVNEVYYIIAGHVSEYTDIAGSDLKGVTMTLSGTHSYSLITDATGYYTFANVRPGDYTLTASKSDDINLDVSDAVKILKAVVRKISLTCMERIAADAFDDGTIGAYDGFRVLNYVVGFANCLNDSCTFW
ncbi:MAG: hypothetical protein OMM_10636, partial [Candidatus Magnetoglobus multicellularis str. Araruama]